MRKSACREFPISTKSTHGAQDKKIGNLFVKPEREGNMLSNQISIKTTRWPLNAKFEI